MLIVLWAIWASLGQCLYELFSPDASPHNPCFWSRNIFVNLPVWVNLHTQSHALSHGFSPYCIFTTVALQGWADIDCKVAFTPLPLLESCERHPCLRNRELKGMMPSNTKAPELRTKWQHRYDSPGRFHNFPRLLTEPLECHTRDFIPKC